MTSKSGASQRAGKSPRRQQISAATDTLALLDLQAKEVRAELAGLQQNLADVQLRLVAARTSELHEANEQSVLAATHADLPGEHSPAMDNLREANQQLVMALLTAQELEEQVHLKHERQVKFMAMVAHELRNPLTPIRTAAALLKGVHTADIMGDAQLLIEAQVERMSRLVEDLLDSTRVSAGKFRVEWGDVQLPSILERAVATCRPEMAARDQSLTLHVPPGSLHIEGDPLRLAQVFSNLLDNASKYTQDGGAIAVTVELSGAAVTVRVCDNGIGISPQTLASIFDLFVQDERALTVCRGGLGIGLAVVRDLVEAHGGTITAHSSGENLGSEFVVTLPIRGPGERLPSLARQSNDPPAQQRGHLRLR